MQLIDNVFQRYRDRTILGVLILLSLSMLLVPRPAKLSFARSAMNVLFAPVEKLNAVVDNYFAVRDENLRLRRMVATMLMERERLLQFREERERLRRLAAFKEEQFYRLIPSEVIGRNIDRFQTVLVIDKGKSDSLAVGMPVFSYQGLAGRLTDVFDESSWVRLLCSKDNPISCIDKRSRVIGVLEWRQRNQFELKNVSAVEDIAAGDTLVTSGFGGVVPKGFPVAVVTRVGPATDGLSLRVDARSHVNFFSLEEVFVMTDEVPWDRSLFYDEADTLLMRDILEDPR
jgi:rod shape-determining protein MreC